MNLLPEVIYRVPDIYNSQFCYYFVLLSFGVPWSSEIKFLQFLDSDSLKELDEDFTAWLLRSYLVQN